MTGRRKAAGKPLAAEASARRRAAAYEDAAGRANRPTLRVSAAANYLMGALARIEQPTADEVAAQVVAELVAQARRLDAAAVDAAKRAASRREEQR